VGGVGRLLSTNVKVVKPTRQLAGGGGGGGCVVVVSGGGVVVVGGTVAVVGAQVGAVDGGAGTGRVASRARAETGSGCSSTASDPEASRRAITAPRTRTDRSAAVI
jgi:hypothetical protein